MYQTIKDIEAEKLRLRSAISEKEKEIRETWEDIFYEKEDTSAKTPTQRLLYYANTGAGIFDGVLFGWKMYRRLGGAFSLFRKKRK